MNFDGISLLLVVAAIGYALTLWRNHTYRRTLQAIAKICKRCSPGTRYAEDRPGFLHLGSGHWAPCPNCHAVRVALGELAKHEKAAVYVTFTGRM
jgi:hypothetical protein